MAPGPSVFARIARTMTTPSFLTVADARRRELLSSRQAALWRRRHFCVLGAKVGTHPMGRRALGKGVAWGNPDPVVPGARALGQQGGASGFTGWMLWLVRYLLSVAAVISLTVTPEAGGTRPVDRGSAKGAAGEVTHTAATRGEAFWE